MITCKALLFDMDGVLIDSTPAVARVWGRWAVEHGFEPEKVIASAHGRPSLMTVQEFLPDADHEFENRVVERMEIEDLEGVIPLPGAVELLNSLPPDRWTIVTSATRTLAEVRLRAARLPIPTSIVTASDIRNGKPHPEPYLKAAAALGCTGSDCIVVEDAVSGIQAGKAAGARVIAFPTTVSRAVLQKARPDWILRNCADIKAAGEVDCLRLTLGGDQPKL
jgi:sugar-phosphatase